jgi:surface protein
MGSMFASATAFNQNIGSWDVSKVETFNNMFNNAAQFNNGGSDSIKNWIIKISGPVTMSGMFQNTFAFNQPINTDGSKWNVSTVTSMSSMFNNATAFNQNIGGWNTGAVINMSSMFASATAFNQNIGGWNTGAVTNMGSMFVNNTSFNQDISTWNVSNVTTFSAMFAAASSFNRNLGAWQLRLTGTNLQNTFESSGMSTANYTDTIVGWANYVQSNSGTPSNVSMSIQTSRIFQNSRSGLPGFGTAGAARTYLTSATPSGAGWTISGDTIIA